MSEKNHHFGMMRSEHFGHVCYMYINVLEVCSSVLSGISEWTFEHISSQLLYLQRYSILIFTFPETVHYVDLD
jgi:hypothetical protein